MFDKNTVQSFISIAKSMPSTQLRLQKYRHISSFPTFITLSRCWGCIGYNICSTIPYVYLCLLWWMWIMYLHHWHNWTWTCMNVIVKWKKYRLYSSIQKWFWFNAPMCGSALQLKSLSVQITTIKSLLFIRILTNVSWLIIKTQIKHWLCCGLLLVEAIENH